jgi:hypothetical protein
MSILDAVKSAFSSSAADKNALWLYVRCARCGTPLAVRVDLRNEPSIDYERGGYVLYKEMMDSKCFTLMRAQVQLDDQHKVIDQSVDKGEFITRERYEQLTAEGKP